MSFRDIRVLYARELRSALRERNVVINSLVIPVLLYPAMIWMAFTVQTLVAGLQEQTPLRVSVAPLPPAWTGLKSQLERDARLEVTAAPVAEEAIARRERDAGLEVTTPPGTAGQAWIVYSTAHARSRLAAERLETHLHAWRDAQLERAGEAAGLSAGDLQVAWIDARNVTPDRQLGSYLLSIILPVSVILFLGFGALYPAVDTTAGERERSTWETLLVTAASRTDIVVAKYLYVVTLATVSGLLNLGVMLACLKALLGPAPGVTLELTPAALLVVLPGTVLLAMFVSAGLMVLASLARTFKQGQSLVSPFFLLVALPGIVTADPGRTFTLPLAFVPVVNMAMVFREAIAGRFPPLQLAITLAVLVACVGAAMAAAAHLLGREDLLLGEAGLRAWIPRLPGRRSRSAPESLPPRGETP